MLALVRDVESAELEECGWVADQRPLRITTEKEFVAEARRLDHTLVARRVPWVTLRVTHLTLGGLSAASGQPLLRGERVSVHVPQRDGRRAFTAYGRVARCEAGERGFEVAVEFEAFPAA